MTIQKIKNINHSIIIEDYIGKHFTAIYICELKRLNFIITK